jgi:hypothetical protein
MDEPLAFEQNYPMAFEVEIRHPWENPMIDPHHAS